MITCELKDLRLANGGDIPPPARSAFLKFYTGDYTAGTIGFTLEQRGFYTECLFRMWERKDGLPHDERWLARALQCDPRTVRRLLKFLTANQKLEIVDGRVVNARMMKEIAEYTNRATSGRDRAKIAGRSGEDQPKIEPKKSKSEVFSTKEATAENHTRIQKPESRIKEPPFSPPEEDMPSHVRPVANWSMAFADPSESEVVLEEGVLTLRGEPYRQALIDFDGSEKRLRFALEQAAGFVRVNSPIPLLAQVRSQLAKQLGGRLDMDSRYERGKAANQAASRPNRPSRYASGAA